ncbi:MAG: multidrug effflux MFS transporter [Paracoccaceae bacterium]
MSAPPDIRILDRTTPPHVVTLILMAGISAMTMSIFLPSLPRMTEEFSTEYGVMQLSVSLYLACTAALQLIVGPLSDRFGRRPVVLGALVLFVVATLGCYLSTTVEVFLAFRMLQASVAICLVLSRANVRDMVPQDEAASVIGYVTMGMALVPMAAPMIGGALDEAFGWRSIFVFMALCGVAMLALCWADQGETLNRQGLSFLDQVRGYPELFTSPRFWGYVFAAAFASGAFFAFLGGAPYVATQVYGQSPAQAGFFFGVPALGYAAGNFVSGRYSIRFGIDRMILTGTVILVAGLATSLAISYASYDSAWQFFGFCTFVGIGNGLVMPNATAGMLSVRPHLAGTASGIGSAIMIGGGAGLSTFAGAMLEGGNGSFPLQWIMLITAICSLLSVSFVFYRTRQLARM